MEKGLKGLKCICGGKLDKAGGIVFVPKKNQKGLEFKHHVCLSCAAEVAAILQPNREPKGVAVATYKSEPLKTYQDGKMEIFSVRLTRHYLRRIMRTLKGK